MAQWPDDVLRFQPDVVVMLYGGFMMDWVIDGQPVRPCDPTYDQRFGQLADRAIEVLSSAGGRVVVALPAYHRVYGEVDDMDRMTDCMSQTFTAAVARRADRALAPAPRPARVPTPSTCDSAAVDGQRLRFDGLTSATGRPVRREFAARPGVQPA